MKNSGCSLAVRAVALSMALGVSPFVIAVSDAEKSLSISAGLDTLSDSNLFRTSGEDETRDQVSSSFVTLQLDKALSRQRVRLDAAVHDYRYRDNDYLDHRDIRGSLNWDWLVTSRVEGVVGADYNESLNSFADYHSATKNIRKRHKYYVEGRGRAIGNLWLLAGASRVDQKNSEQFLSEDDYRLDVVDTGLLYRTTAGNSLGLVISRGDGTYTDREADSLAQLDSGFEQTETQLRFRWNYAGHTVISGYLGRLEREHDHYRVRDFSGETGEIKMEYLLTADLRLDVVANQNLLSYQTVPTSDLYWQANGQGYYNSSYYQLRTLRFVPVWQFSDKIRLRAGFEQGKRDYRGGLMAELGQRDDRLRTLSVGADWQPRPFLKLSALAVREKRTSNRQGADFTSDMAGAAISFIY